MDLKLLAPLFALALAIGWFFPQAESAPKAAVEQPPKAVQSQLDVSRQPKPPKAMAYGGYGQVTIDRMADGHFYANAKIVGTPVRFLIDTGASMIALTGNDARALGFSWHESELQRIGRGASGDVFGKPVMLNSVAVGGIEFNNLEAVIIPEGLDVSLLGQSFLGKIDNVQIERDRMTLGG
jgi:aspartyl protease family protein